TDASNTYAASPKDSSTTETTAYAASSTPADSNTSYTLKCEEPLKLRTILASCPNDAPKFKTVRARCANPATASYPPWKP
ncbi:hypothetical protein, partial [Actinomyces sp. ICM47]|uniref:hypothetical protein n=1 Tax=Actinomyces sp. ICM47 TaxID=936548 RepID=UPI0025BB3BD6